MDKVYLDNNATTPLHPEVKDTIIKSLDLYGNASSKHSLGKKVRVEVEATRKLFADYIGANSNEIYFTSGASEANNLVLKSVTACGKSCSAYHSGTPHIITTKIEHPSVLNTLQCLQGMGVEVTYVEVNEEGLVSISDIEKNIKENTVLISVMFANNEIGTIQPIYEIGKIAKKHNVKFHTDAVQVFGKMPLNVEELNIDFMTFSGHKFNALKGTGGLYRKASNHLCPLIHGGHQEGMLRAGTENTLGIISMKKALEIHIDNMSQEEIEIKKMRDDFEDYILKEIPHTYLNGDKEKRLWNTSNISFDFVEGEAILLMLDHFGICVSTGSACNSDSLDPSHVLMALGKRIELAHSSVRFSFGLTNTWEEVEYTKEKVKAVIERLRMLSPLNK